MRIKILDSKSLFIYIYWKCLRRNSYGVLNSRRFWLELLQHLQDPNRRSIISNAIDLSCYEDNFMKRRKFSWRGISYFCHFEQAVFFTFLGFFEKILRPQIIFINSRLGNKLYQLSFVNLENISPIVKNFNKLGNIRDRLAKTILD